MDVSACAKRIVQRGEEEPNQQVEQVRVVGDGQNIGFQDDGHAERVLELAARLGEIVWNLKN